MTSVTVPVVMVLAGAAIVFVSIVAATGIRKDVTQGLRAKWLLAVSLLVFFLLGYAFSVFILLDYIAFPLELVTGGVFFGGALFVYLVIRLSGTSLEYIREKDRDIQAYAEGLSARTTQLEHEIAERVKAEETLRAERDRVQTYLDIAKVMFVVIGADGKVTLVNRKGCEVLGYPEEEIVGRNWFEHFVPSPARGRVKYSYNRLMAGESNEVEDLEYPVLKMNGEERVVAWHNTVLRDGEGRIRHALSSGEDITERKRAEEQARFRLRHLSALHSIDMIISSSLDMEVTLKVFLEQAVSHLSVDAACILLLDRYTQVLRYFSGVGFRTPDIQGTTRKLGEGSAGIAAMERRIVKIPDLSEAVEAFGRAALIEGEDFTAYLAVPLAAKGKVQGVLEIFHRAPLVISPEWLDFLEALSLQAAIAIDSTRTFNDLQRSNAELILAYDTTLEGWSRALELRDEETEGHTRRVVDLTLRIARAMGMTEEELVHVRRGALLHDIGKMSIPDRILLSEGPLSDEEMEVMRRHPFNAFELLSPIAYLRPALDIPYCHHEKWDGTGYPRNLKGTHIPLAARIFTVVDMWDALRSERRYQPVWPRDKACEHIRSLAGTHFDPEVVDIFLKLECGAEKPEGGR